MSRLYMIKEINIEKFPVVIITDSHTNLANVRALRELYPDNKFICLGDITFLHSKPGEQLSANTQALSQNNADLRLAQIYQEWDYSFDFLNCSAPIQAIQHQATIARTA